MTTKKTRPTRRPKSRKGAFGTFAQYAPICLLLGLIAYRVAFDVKAYFYGATLEIRGASRSGYDYLLRVPPGYSVFSGKRPLLIYLHGAGQTGEDVSELRAIDPFVWAQDCVDAEDYPFITITPVAPTYGWEPERVKILTDELLSSRSRFAVDEKRVYLTGYSMGGFGAFATAAEYPELFAAIAPVAGGGNVAQAPRLKDLPTWAFHGDADETVPYSSSQEMLDAMRNAGAREARLTTYRGAGHRIAEDVYRDPRLYRWFLAAF